MWNSYIYYVKARNHFYTTTYPQLRLVSSSEKELLWLPVPVTNQKSDSPLVKSHEAFKRMRFRSARPAAVN